MTSILYPNAPITEAVFDIRIKPKDNSYISKLKEIPESVKIIFPTVRNRPGIKLTFQDNAPNLNQVQSIESGYIFSNRENNRLFQFRLDGFTFNALKPYSSWNDFSTEALSLWELYKSLIPDFEISRLGLRYINRINLPFPITSFEEYITYVPPIPAGLPKILNRFFMQVEIPIDTDGIKVVLTETIEPLTNDNGEQLPFILDIDCVKDIDVILDTSMLRDCFNTMRQTKNNIFESCITDKARNLFK